MAAGHALTAYQRVALQNVQVHGGIAIPGSTTLTCTSDGLPVLQAFAGDQDALQDRVIALQREACAGASRWTCPRAPSSIARPHWISG